MPSDDVTLVNSWLAPPYVSYSAKASGRCIVIRVKQHADGFAPVGALLSLTVDDAIGLMADLERAIAAAKEADNG